MADKGRRWHDREPLSIWLPFSAVAAATVQTLSYVGYKLFYGSLGVRPEEVGYDYASLFPRSALQLASLITVVLGLLSVASIAIAIYGAMLKPMFDDLRGRGSPLTNPGARATAGGLGCALLASLVSGWTGLEGDEYVVLLAALVGVSLAAGHWHAWAEGRPDTSVLSFVMTPRVYRGSRRLVLLAVAITLTSVYSPSVPQCVALLLVLYGVDRFLPVVPSPGDADAPGGGSSKWLRRTVTLGMTGAVAFALLMALSALLDLSDLDDKAERVRAGERLKYSLLDPLTLAEPRADPVSVRWVAPRAPEPFTSSNPRQLTYLGQNGGTAVFLDTARKPQVIHRLPVAALAVDGSADSILLP